MRVDAVHHEGGDGAGRVVLARVARALQVVEDLLVDVAEVLAVGEVVEVDIVDLVEHLPHQLAALHVVVGVLEHVAHDLRRSPGLGPRWLKALQRREQFAVDEGEQRLAGDALRVGGPGAPLQCGRDR